MSSCGLQNCANVVMIFSSLMLLFLMVMIFRNLSSEGVLFLLFFVVVHAGLSYRQQQPFQQFYLFKRKREKKLKLPVIIIY